MICNYNVRKTISVCELFEMANLRSNISMKRVWGEANFKYLQSLLTNRPDY